MPAVHDATEAAAGSAASVGVVYAAPSRAARALGLAAVVLVGVNLRPAITSVAALLDEVSTQFALDPLAASVLVTLPVIALGATAPLGPWLARRWGVSWALAATMAALAAALSLRVIGAASLLVGTVVAGAAIMAASTLVPQYLKSLGASGLWVGISTMSFGAGAAAGAGLTAPLYAWFGDDARLALGAWAALAAAAALAMAAAARGSGGRGAGGSGPGGPGAAAGGSSERPRLAVPRGAGRTIALVTTVFALQALLYFAVTAWLPRLVIDRGESTATAGSLLAWFSIVGLLPTLVTPILARRPRVLAWFGPAIGIVVAAGYAWLLVADPSQYVDVVGLLGVFQSAAFALGISLIVSLSANPASAGVVSAVAQGVGFAVAGVGSLLIGLLHDVSGGWTVSFTVMAGIALALSVAVWAVARRPPVDLVASER
ncbi:MFS transporter [Microbacterium jejuense]|uniref:MFS transporter n=1 Tax=Microbacterium jejuense TaxID=1263637 RepID=UPI0031EC0526